MRAMVQLGGCASASAVNLMTARRASRLQPLEILIAVMLSLAVLGRRKLTLVGPTALVRAQHHAATNYAELKAAGTCLRAVGTRPRLRRWR
jgi:hypothetical protein